MSSAFVKKSIQERLESLYSREDALKAKVEIDRLIAYYKERVVSRPHKMDQRDVILITYGDQLVQVGREPLEALNTFLVNYLKDVINSVHILPFYPYSSDDGFSVIDYKDVSPRMGSWEDIERIGENFYIMFDGVINHISQYSYWFKGFLQNDPKFKDFFVEVEEGIDLSKVVRPRTLPLIHTYKDVEGRDRHIWTTFSKDQVDLNYANYKVLVAVLDVLLYYVEKGAKLIRLDAIAFLWKEIGTECIHLPQTHEVIQLMREVIHKVAPEVVIITETNVPHKENVSYFGSGDDEAQMVYNFALPPLTAHAILTGDTSILTKWAKELELPSDKVCFFNFTASHDGCGVRPVSGLLSQEDIALLIEQTTKNGGFVSYRSLGNGEKSPYELNASYIDIISDKREEIDLRVDKFILSQAVKLAMPGVPGVYFHSLVGSTSDIDGVRRTGVYRSINREKLNYDYLVQELEDESSLRNKIFSRYIHLLKIRREEDAFDPYGKFEILDLADGVFALLRESKVSRNDILVLNNFTNRSILVKLPPFVQGDLVELIDRQKIENREVRLKPYGVAWIKFRKEF